MRGNKDLVERKINTVYPMVPEQHGNAINWISTVLYYLSEGTRFRQSVFAIKLDGKQSIHKPPASIGVASIKHALAVTAISRENS